MQDRPEDNWDIAVRRRIPWLERLARRLPRRIRIIIFPRLSRQIDTLRIATLSRLTDEMFADYPQVWDYVNKRLPFLTPTTIDERLVGD